MNELQLAAFELRLDDLKQVVRQGGGLRGALLAASSAHDADPSRQVSVLRWLLRQGADVNETDANSVTPLQRAVRFRNMAAVKELIEQGADVNAIDKKTRSTPLHRAVTNTGAPATAGKVACAAEIAKLLLAHAADPGIKNKRGKTPIDYATASRQALSSAVTVVAGPGRPPRLVASIGTFAIFDRGRRRCMIDM